jgi:HAMP domain-containing protein
MAAPVGVTATNVKIQVLVIERMVAMSRLVKAIRSRHDINRTRRELNRAIANATTPAMRDELILVAQRDGKVL